MKELVITVRFDPTDTPGSMTDPDYQAPWVVTATVGDDTLSERWHCNNIPEALKRIATGMLIDHDLRGSST